jgi:hypothetical protein
MEYTYSGLNILNKNDTFDRTFETVYVCAYKIDTRAMIPFIQYLLYKNNTLSFPSFKYTNANSSTIINDTIVLLSFLFKSPSINCLYNGYLTMDDDLYLFFDISNNNETTTGQKLWFSLIDEIINYNNICNFQIESTVSTLFLNNNQLLTLHDLEGNEFETPVVAYSGQHDSMLNFTFVFGVSDTEISGNYSFTDYVHSIKSGGWSKTGLPEIKYGKLITDNEYGRYIKGGIVRFVLFLGKNGIINNTELLTTNWTSEFDSIYYNRLGTPTWIVSKLEQQYPLTYHYIDKKSLSASFNANDVYFIL